LSPAKKFGDFWLLLRFLANFGWRKIDLLGFPGEFPKSCFCLVFSAGRAPAASMSTYEAIAAGPESFSAAECNFSSFFSWPGKVKSIYFFYCPFFINYI